MEQRTQPCGRRACGVRRRACATGAPFPRVERLILEISSFKGYGGYVSGGGEGRVGVWTHFSMGGGGEKGVTIVFAVEIVRVTGFRASYDRVASSLLTLNRIVFQFLLFPRFSVSTSSPPGDARTLEGVRLSNGINGVGENKF